MRPTLSNKEQQIIALCKGLDWRYDKFDNTTEPYVSNDIIYVPARVNLEVLTDLVNEYSLRQCRLILEKLKRKLLASDFDDSFGIVLKEVIKNDDSSPWYVLVITKEVKDYDVYGNKALIPITITYNNNNEMQTAFIKEEWKLWNSIPEMISYIKDKYEQLEQKNIKEWRERNERLRIEQEKEAKIKSQVKDDILKIINSFNIDSRSQVDTWNYQGHFYFIRGDKNSVDIYHKNRNFDEMTQTYTHTYSIMCCGREVFKGTLKELTNQFENVENSINTMMNMTRKEEPTFGNNTKNPWSNY